MVAELIQWEATPRVSRLRSRVRTRVPLSRDGCVVRVRFVLPPDGAAAEPFGYLGGSHRDGLPGSQLLSVRSPSRRPLRLCRASPTRPVSRVGRTARLHI